MKAVVAWITAAATITSSPALAQTEGRAPSWPTTLPADRQAALATMVLASTDGLPQLKVDPFWPKPLPNNWILGQVSGVAVDKRNHVWIVHRPATLSDREVGAAQTPPWSKCCYAAPPVLVFDQSGNLVRHWGGPGQGYDWPQSEHGISVDDNDF